MIGWQSFFKSHNDPEDLTLKHTFDELAKQGSRYLNIGYVIDAHLQRRRDVLLLVDGERKSANRIFSRWPLAETEATIEFADGNIPNPMDSSNTSDEATTNTEASVQRFEGCADVPPQRFSPNYRDLFGSWRRPDDQSIVFWLDHPSQRNKRAKRMRGAIDELFRTRISAVQSPSQFAEQVCDKGSIRRDTHIGIAESEPFSRLSLALVAQPDSGSPVDINGTLNPRSLKSGRLFSQILVELNRLRSFFLQLPGFKQKAGSNSIRFLQKILDGLLQDPIVALLLSPRGENLTAQQLGSMNIFAAKSKAERAPEQAALIALGLIYNALSNRDVRRLSTIFSFAASLALHADFVTKIVKTRTGKNLDVVEQLTLDLFVKALTLQDYDVDLSGYAELSELNLPIFSVITYVPEPWTAERVDVSTDRFIFDGKVPLSVLSQSGVDDPEIVTLGMSALASIDVETLSKVSASGGVGHVVEAKSLKIAQYSSDEEILSGHTANIAKAFRAGIADLVGQSDAMLWLQAVELPIDDLIFKSGSEFWSVICHIQKEPRDGLAIVTNKGHLQAAFVAALRAVSHPKAVRLASLQGELKPAANDHDFGRQIVDLFFRDPGAADYRMAQHYVLDALKRGQDVSIPQVPAKSAIVIGRPLDRNYSTDLKELGRELRKNNFVVFMPTVRQSIINQIPNIVDFASADWHDEVIKEPADTQFRSADMPVIQRAPSILPYLVDFAVKNNLLNLAELALVLYLQKRLDDFFRSRIFNYLQAGAEAAMYLKSVAPAHVSLLPGRDFISQVACLVGRQEGFPSFDVQTVFVGPRSRYKPTLADIQFTIESHSCELFKSYFGLPNEKIVLSGCSKVGVVQDAARRLDRDAVRQSTNMSDKFLLVFAGSPFLEEDEPIISAVADTLLGQSEMHLGIRLHPTADTSFPEFCSALSQSNPSVSVLSSLSLPETLIAADIMITRFSNVGLEAALSGRDVIACNFTGAAPPISLDHMGVATIARSPEELRECISDFRVRGKRWRDLQLTRNTYLSKNPQFLEGPASAYMKTLIESHVNSRVGRLDI